MQKNLVISEKSSTFAPAFQKKEIGRSPWGPRKSADFWGERRPRETYPYDRVVWQSEGAEREVP